MATAMGMNVRGMIDPTQRKTLNEQIREAQAKGDTETVRKLTGQAGLLSSTLGVVTGIPDLAITGYNWATGSNIKDLRTRALEAAGVPTEAPNKEDSFTYNQFDYALMALSLGQLAKSGWKGFKNLRESKKIKDFQKTLPPTQANRFERFMMNGQGSDDPMVMAALQQMRKDPKYAEFFTTLDKAATETAVKAMSPRPSRLAPQTATEKAVTAVQNTVESLKNTRDTVADAQFTKAYSLAGDKGLVPPAAVVSGLDNLRKRYSNIKTPEAEKMLSAIDGLKDTFMPGGASAQPLTVPQIQQLLSEFGKKIGQDDAVIKGLSQADLEVLNKTVFGSLKTDLETALKTAATVDDRRALGALVQARSSFSKASDAYNKAISQGIPKFLQGKSIDTIDPEMLFSEYKKLNPVQRTTFRDYVGSSSKEALQFLDKKTFDNFLAGSFTKLPDGTMGYDLGKLAENWATLQKKKPDEADMLVKALGTNATEFSGRMKDALVFTRKMDVGAPVAEQQGSVFGGMRRALPGAVGSTAAGYQGAKATDLSLQTAEAILAKRGLTPDQLMKALLTPEGAQFLRSAALSPNSRQTLEALTKMEAAAPTGRSIAALSAASSTLIDRETGMDVAIPEDLMQEIAIPDDIAAPVEPAAVPQEGMEDDVFIPEDLMTTPQQQPLEQQPAPSMQPMSMGMDEEENIVRGVIQQMKAKDPYLNEDYVMNAYRNAPQNLRQQFLQVYGVQQ